LEAALVDFAKFREAQSWLDDQTPELALSVSARMALRILPLIVTYQRQRPASTFFRTKALPTFRSGAVPWVAACFPSRAADFRRAASAAARDTRGAYNSAGVGNDTTYAIAYQAAHRTAHGTSDTSFPFHVDYVGAFADAYRAASAADEADAAAVEAREAQNIATAPLWPASTPSSIGFTWERLKSIFVTCRARLGGVDRMVRGPARR